MCAICKNRLPKCADMPADTMRTFCQIWLKEIMPAWMKSEDRRTAAMMRGGAGLGNVTKPETYGT